MLASTWPFLSCEASISQHFVKSCENNTLSSSTLSQKFSLQHACLQNFTVTLFNLVCLNFSHLGSLRVLLLKSASWLKCTVASLWPWPMLSRPKQTSVWSWPSWTEETSGATYMALFIFLDNNNALFSCNIYILHKV